MSLAEIVLTSALQALAGMAFVAFLIMPGEKADAYAEGYQQAEKEWRESGGWEASALDPVPIPDGDGFTEPPLEWDDKSLAALHSDAPEAAQVHRFTPHRPAEEERLAVPVELDWSADPELASGLALMDAQESVALAAAARLRAQLTDSIPVIKDEPGRPHGDT